MTETGNNNLDLRKRYALDLMRQNRVGEAEGELLLLSGLLPGDQTVWLELGRARLVMGRYQDAIGSLHNAIKFGAKSADACFLLGVALGQSGNMTDALTSLEQALNLNPNHVEACIAQGVVLQLSGNSMAAIASFERAWRLDPDHVGVNVRLGGAYSGIDNRMATRFFRMALERQPNHPEAVCGLAYLHIYKGEALEAYRVLESLLQQRPLNMKVAAAFASICRPLQRCTEAIGLLEEGLSGVQDVESQCLAHFSLGKLYDQMHEYEQAFDHYSKGNARANRYYNPREDSAWFNGMIANMNAAFFERTPRAVQHPNQKDPLFIVGMPRSGTTLVEQILASHPAVWGAGELAELGSIAASLPAELGVPAGYPACLSRIDLKALNKLALRYYKYISDISPDGAVIVIDKMPDNFRFLGFIELLFPAARVIHCRRDPVDTCLSCYFQHFEGGHFYSYDLRSLGIYYRMYERLMAHWSKTLNLSIMEVQYEKLVEHPEQVSRSLFDFCGLDWSPKCLEFFKEKRDVATASHDQVRQPIYSSSVGRWKHYANHLQDLLDGLERNAG